MEVDDVAEVEEASGCCDSLLCFLICSLVNRAGSALRGLHPWCRGETNELQACLHQQVLRIQTRFPYFG